jgi:hypothetical protein
MISKEFEEAAQRLERAIDNAYGPASGDPKLDAGRNLVRITHGLTTPEEAGEPFYRAEDGTIGINAEGTAFEGLMKEILGEK